jgi:hypothetical protein
LDTAQRTPRFLPFTSRDDFRFWLLFAEPTFAERTTTCGDALAGPPLSLLQKGVPVPATLSTDLVPADTARDDILLFTAAAFAAMNVVGGHLNRSLISIIAGGLGTGDSLPTGPIDAGSGDVVLVAGLDVYVN